MATYNFGAGQTYSNFAAAIAAAEAAEPSPFTEQVIIQGKGTIVGQSFNAGSTLNPTATFRLLIRPIPGETLTLNANNIASRGLRIGDGLSHVDWEDILVQKCTERTFSCDGSSNDDITLTRCRIEQNPTTETGSERGFRLTTISTNFTFTECTFFHGLSNFGHFSFAPGNASDDLVFKKCTFEGGGPLGAPAVGSQGDETMRFENCKFISRTGGSNEVLTSMQGYFGFRYCVFMMHIDGNAITLGGGSSGCVIKNCVFHMQIGVGSGIFVDVPVSRDFFESDHNALYVKTGGASGHFAKYEGSFVDTFAAWKSTSGQDANSIDADPRLIGLFEGLENPHLLIDSPCIGAGTPIAGITTDFDGDTRDATTPDIGFDEAVYPTPVTLLDDLVASLALSEPSGTLVDSQGDNDGTATGATQGASPIILGTASVLFSGGSGRIVLLNEENFDRENSQPWTASLWMAPTDPGAGPSPVFLSKFGFSRNFFFSIVRVDSTTYRIRMDFISTGGSMVIAASADSFTFGEKVHFFFTYDGSRSRSGTNIYINNVLMDKGTNPNTSHPLVSTVLTDGAIILGAKDSAGLNAFTGRMQQFDFWNRELSGPRRINIYNNGSGMAFPFLIGGPKINVFNRVGGIGEFYR